MTLVIGLRSGLSDGRIAVVLDGEESMTVHFPETPNQRVRGRTICVMRNARHMDVDGGWTIAKFVAYYGEIVPLKEVVVFPVPVALRFLEGAHEIWSAIVAKSSELMSSILAIEDGELVLGGRVISIDDEVAANYPFGVDVVERLFAGVDVTPHVARLQGFGDLNVMPVVYDDTGRGETDGRTFVIRRRPYLEASPGTAALLHAVEKNFADHPFHGEMARIAGELDKIVYWPQAR